jgi:hypothetical protein
MTLNFVEIFVAASSLSGCVSGAASGSRHSILLAGIGAGIGLVLGLACFVALAFPFAWCTTRIEMPEQVYSTSPLGKWLFFPVMIVVLGFAIIAPWFAVGLFV